MGLTIRSSHKQELSSVYQFIDVLYSLCIYEALRHWSLGCLLLLLQFRVLSALYLCRAIYTKLVVIWLATIGRCYYWSHTSARSVRLYTGECVVDSSTGLWDRALLPDLSAPRTVLWAVAYSLWLPLLLWLQIYQIPLIISEVSPRRSLLLLPN